MTINSDLSNREPAPQPANRPDRRVRRTRGRLHIALMELIVEKGYDRTTVQDLIDRADIGRSTFYAHYETKDDLLLSSLERLDIDIELHIGNDSSDAILSSLGFFRHIAEQRELFQALIGSRGIDIVIRATREALTRRVEATIAERESEGAGSAALPSDARAAFAAGSLLAFLTWWLDNDMPYSPEDMATMFSQMTEAV